MSGFIRLNDIRREGDYGRSIPRMVRAGELERIARGRYLPTPEWNALDADLRYRARIHGYAETVHTQQVFSHWSAAALWGYPIVGPWPRQIFVTLGTGTGQRSSPLVIRHVTDLSDDDVVELDGLLVTSPLRTLLDLARAAPFSVGVAAFDFALAGSRPGVGDLLHVPREALRESAAQLSGARGVRRLRRVLEFADMRSGSSGESYSRVQIARLGLPAPDLQVEVIDIDGRVWHPDFGWKLYRAFGEFDGMVKYTRNRYLQGRDVADVVIEEKLREDAIRLATGYSMARWITPVAADLAQLRKTLFAAGIRVG